MRIMMITVAGWILLRAAACTTVAADDPLQNWTWRNPLPQGNPLYGVTHGNGTYVAVGPNGTIVTSTDGFHWFSQNPGTNAAFDAVAHGNGLFVIVGRNGSILTSPDGKAWTDRSLNPFQHLNAVTYGSHRFVALGQTSLESDENIVTSEDGVTWVAGTIPVTTALTGVTFADGLFVAVGCDVSGNGSIATSPDGTNWTTREARGLNSVAYGNGRFVAVGGDAYNGGPNVLVSTNGLDWSTQNVSGTRKAITFGNGLFVATDGLFEAKVHVSSDGVTWETHAFPTVEFAQAITYGGGQFVTVGLWGTILGSPNAIDWTLRIERVGPMQDFTGIATDGRRVVAAQALGGKLVSTNGIEWNYRAAPALSNIYYLNGITFGAGRFVAAGATRPYDPNHSRVIVDTSADGELWTHDELTWSGALRALAFGNGQFVAVGDGFPSLVIASPDGVSWTRPTVPALATVLHDIVFASGRFLAVGNLGRMLISTNGIDWADVSQFGLDRDLYGVAYGNGYFVAVGKYGVAISPDGLNWQTSSFSGPASSDFSGIDFVSGVFLGRTTAGTKLSENGSEWTPRPWIQYYGSRRIVETMGTLFSVGFGGGILQSAPLSALPRLSSLRIGGGDSYQLTITGGFPRRCRIEMSRDLSSWQPLATLTLTNSTQVLHDPAPDPEHRFYRAIANP